ncbi:MAG: condensation domain-containing protein, partial [Acidobacteria bacterium]|nr:condensation domain-containing protein [Acidobacteriota bacterium]
TNDYFYNPLNLTNDQCPMTNDYFYNPLNLTNDQCPMTNDRFYKTGDLARWLPDGPPAGGGSGGVIEFLGRIDQQVKVRGFRIELEEIENRLSSYRSIKEAVVVAKEDNAGDRYLCAYIVEDTSKPKATGEALKEFLAQTLPGYMIPSYFVSLEKIPLNPNGKVNRKALPEPVVLTGDSHVAPRDIIEEKLVNIWSDLLNIEKESISIDANFFQLGGHSLKCSALALKIQKELDVKLSLVETFKINTIRKLSEHIMRSEKNKYLIIEPIEKKEYYDVSFGQKRIFLLSQTPEASLTFNMQSSYQLKEAVALEAFNNAFAALIERHENLRTVFHVISEEVKQKILPTEKLNYQVNYQDFRDRPDKEKQIQALISAEAGIPFDLVNGPLMRTQLIQIEEKEFVFLYTMHHIISDFISMEILQKEFLQLYEAFKKVQENPLSPLKFQYKDFACWQNKQLAGPYLDQLRDYWGRQFNNNITLLQLPYDKERPRLQSYNGKTAAFTISENPTDKLRTIANENNATLFMILLASVNLLLAFYSGQNDITIGTPVSGREHPDLENQIGFYLNTLALRTKFNEQIPFSQLLEIVKEVVLGAFEHQMYPFDKLIDDFKIKREPGRHPLFDVMVDMINVTQRPGSQPVETIETDTGKNSSADDLQFAEMTNPIAKFDLVIYFYEELKDIHVIFEYNTDLFERKTISRMVKRYRDRLSSIIKNPLAPVSRLLQGLFQSAETHWN